MSHVYLDARSRELACETLSRDRVFPYGVQPEAVSALPPDTVNRLLLHGARYHDRDAVFLDSDGSTPHPDWRADRHSLRIALALAERHGVGPGQLVVLDGPVTLERLLAERAVWGLGAATAFPPHEGDAIVSGAAAIRELLESGAALDTPERASRFREAARDVPPSALASIEHDVGERSQAAWVRDIEDVLLKNPPRQGERRVLSLDMTWHRARVVAFAGWADGLTTTVMGLE